MIFASNNKGKIREIQETFYEKAYKKAKKRIKSTPKKGIVYV